MIFHVDDIDLVSRLIDGQFPNYQQVLPSSHTTRAVVERDELLKAVRLSALIASSAANVVKLRLGDEGANVHHHRRRRRRRRGRDRVEAPIEGDAVQIAFNAQYLPEALANVDDEQLALEFSGPLSPGVFKPTVTARLCPRDHARAHALLSPALRPAR